ncbi:MAG: hypothetical protein NZZ41_00325 [Candidatus Dojkabacteria bacterium]|nr:hypothetical protein [Candidatus Dojkabacteria bacterium]
MIKEDNEFDQMNTISKQEKEVERKFDFKNENFYSIERDKLGSRNKPYSTKKIISLKDLNILKNQKIAKIKDTHLKKQIAKTVYGKRPDSV